MDWLEGNNPMHVHWAEKWLQFQHKGKSVKIQGISSQAQMGSLISPSQLEAMVKQNFILCCVQLNSVSENQSEETPIPSEI